MKTEALVAASVTLAGLVLSEEMVKKVASALGRALADSRQLSQTAAGERAVESASVSKAARLCGLTADEAARLSGGWRIISAIRSASSVDVDALVANVANWRE